MANIIVFTTFTMPNILHAWYISEVYFKPLPGNNLNTEAEMLFRWEINYKYLLILLAATGVQATNGEGTSFFVSWTNLKEYLNLPLFGMFPAYIARQQNTFEKDSMYSVQRALFFTSTIFLYIRLTFLRQLK